MTIDLLNAGDTDIANFGGGTLANLPKWSYAASVANTTDAQAAAGVQANPRTAAIKDAASAGDKAALGLALILSLAGYSSANAAARAGTVGLRKKRRLERALDDYVKFLNQISA